MVEAVKIAKRSSLYRESRSRLYGPAPADVWAEVQRGVHFVLFGLKACDSRQSYLGFVVNAQRKLVVEAGVLALSFSSQGLQIQNSGLGGER